MPFGLGTGFGIGVELPLSELELELNCKNGIDPSSAIGLLAIALCTIYYSIYMSYRNKGIICCVHKIIFCIYMGSRLLAERCINTAELFIVLTDSVSLFNN